MGGMTYDGLLPGPTLRLRPGDRLKIKLANNLGGAMTNLHMHGMHVSPRGNSDNVFLHIENGQTFDYEYDLPANHPAGLLWYGWAAQAHQHWAVVDAGVAVFGCGIILSTQAMQQYIMESYREYVASAAAASQFLRSIFGFCFPLFAPALHASLDYGYGNTTLALISLGLNLMTAELAWYLLAPG